VSWQHVYEDFSDLNPVEKLRLYEATKDTLFPEPRTFFHASPPSVEYLHGNRGDLSKTVQVAHVGEPRFQVFTIFCLPNHW
jgi:hypothetical protein